MNTPDIASRTPEHLAMLREMLSEYEPMGFTAERAALEAALAALASPAGEGDETRWPPFPEGRLFAHGEKVYSQKQMRAFAAEYHRLATPEQPGSSVQGDAVAWLFVRAPRDANGMPHYVTDYFADLPVGRYTLYTTPPPAPAAEQGDGLRLPTLDGFRGLHPDTLALVRRFAYALACKLSAAEQKYGHSDGWMSDDWMDECRAKLVEHVAKGDPRDVAAYCAFLWHHDERTALPQPEARGVEGKEEWKAAILSKLREVLGTDGTVYREVAAMLATAPAAPVGVDEVRAKYDELLLAVGNKYPGESRHETALRYIRGAEALAPGAGVIALTMSDRR